MMTSPWFSSVISDEEFVFGRVVEFKMALHFLKKTVNVEMEEACFDDGYRMPVKVK